MRRKDCISLETLRWLAVSLVLALAVLGCGGDAGLQGGGMDEPNAAAGADFDTGQDLEQAEQPSAFAAGEQPGTAQTSPAIEDPSAMERAELQQQGEEVPEGRTMPQTASRMPLAGLIGALALVGAVMLAMMRRR